VRSGEGEMRKLIPAPHFSCIYAEKVREGAETPGVTGFGAIFSKNRCGKSEEQKNEGKSEEW